MALRRPPRIVPEGRNETMLREYRLLAALADTDVPTPGPWPCATTRRSWGAAST